MNTYDQVLETIPTGPASASVRIQGTDTIICSRITDHFAAEVVRRWSIAPELLAAGQAFERAYAACNTILAPMEREAFDQLVNAIAKATNTP